jgi:hypothetical protein
MVRLAMGRPATGVAEDEGVGAPGGGVPVVLAVLVPVPVDDGMALEDLLGSSVSEDVGVKLGEAVGEGATGPVGGW